MCSKMRRVDLRTVDCGHALTVYILHDAAFCRLTNKHTHGDDDDVDDDEYSKCLCKNPIRRNVGLSLKKHFDSLNIPMSS